MVEGGAHWEGDIEDLQVMEVGLVIAQEEIPK